MIRIALAQINPTVGDLKNNCEKIISYIKEAKKKGVELVVFPELSLTGCPPEDLLLKNNFISKNKYYLNVIKKACVDITALVGFVDEKQGNIYNSCAIIQDRKVQDIYHEMVLPANGVFDEKRYFSTGDVLPLYIFKNYKFALSICEDIRQKSFVELLKDNKVDFVINLSASPFHLDKVLKREKTLSYAAKYTNSFVFYCNLIGGQDEVVFDGTSKVFSPQGCLIAHAKRFSQDLLIFNLNKNKKYFPKKISDKEEEEAFSALRLGLSDYFRKNKFKKAVVGVSGGIDSAVVIALAQIVLGKDNVYALIMPSRYTSTATFEDAKRICGNLGLRYHIVNINEAIDIYIDNLKPHFKGQKPDKTEENLQARIRGNFLMAFSNKFGYIVLNTGNKSETSCGYCTLYGDMVGGFGILSDVPKRLVYKLAYYMNKILGKNAIPLSIIKRPPSAELKPNQKDSDSLPPYGLLDPILKLYVEDNLSLDEIAKKGYKRSLVKKIIKMVDANEYKRRQAPIGIKITPKAFGKDRRMPVTNRFFQ
ncbi:MAG: NAD+ synthase [Candidatus Omnitrophota bacterium]